jgi:DNA-directed RNA polymerase subunit M/transcription elongation factor TFIIS
MTHEIPCPSCGEQLKVPDDLLGQRARCPSCGTIFTTALEDKPSAVRTAVKPTTSNGPTRTVPDVTAAPPTPSAEFRARSSFRCPNCQSDRPPMVSKQISAAGWITFAVLLVTCFPLFWIGLLITEPVRRCADCGTNLG